MPTLRTSLRILRLQPWDPSPELHYASRHRDGKGHGTRYEFPYAGRIKRRGVLAAFAPRIADPDRVTALLWINDDDRVAFVAAAHEAYVRGSAQQVPNGEAVPRSVDALARWAYLDSVS